MMVDILVARAAAQAKTGEARDNVSEADPESGDEDRLEHASVDAHSERSTDTENMVCVELSDLDEEDRSEYDPG